MRAARSGYAGWRTSSPTPACARSCAGEQVAIFRLGDDSVYALDNRDPFSTANVLSRGIVGDLKGELVVASPVYKQHFNLVSGRCVEDAAVQVPVYRARVEDGFVCIEISEIPTTCCYCGVGCGVLASVSGNTITSVRGDPAHPRQLRPAVHQGLVVAQSRSLVPRTVPRSTRPKKNLGRDLGLPRRALRKRPSRSTVPTRSAFYISGQLLTEDYYVFNKLRQGADRDQQRRHQLAPVHGVGGGGLQADARRGRAARLLRGHRFGGMRVHRRQQYRLGSSGPLQEHRARRSRSTSIVVDPRKHRDRALGDRCTCRSRRAPMSRSSTACWRVMLREGWCDDKLHPPAHREFRTGGAGRE